MLNLDVFIILLRYEINIQRSLHHQRLHSSNFEAFHKTITSRAELNHFKCFVIRLWEYETCATNAFQRVVVQASITL